MKPIAYINVEKRTLEFAKNIFWHTPTVANIDRIPLFTKKALADHIEDNLVMVNSTEALKLALEALITITDAIYVNSQQEADAVYKANDAVKAIKEALAQPDQYAKGYADAMNWKVQNHLEHLPAAQKLADWKLLPREATREMLEAMDECSTIGYDERLYAGHAASVYMAAWDEAPNPPEQEPEFIKHEVESAEDWSEWVCPDAKGYLMKCCDCGLVHEAEFGVVRYKSETEREDCEPVEDPNLQAVFRMRRSEQWSPEDTAHRAGGLPMAQPEQEPVAWRVWSPDGDNQYLYSEDGDGAPLYTHPPQRTWVGLTDEEISKLWNEWKDAVCLDHKTWAKAIEAELRSKNGY